MYLTTKISLFSSHHLNILEISVAPEAREAFSHVITVGGHICICPTCFLRKNLEQCWRAELWPAAGETEGPPAQGPGGGMLLWGDDCPQHPHGDEAPGTGGRVPAHRQVSGGFMSLCFVAVSQERAGSPTVRPTTYILKSLICASLTSSFLHNLSWWWLYVKIRAQSISLQSE